MRQNPSSWREAQGTPALRAGVQTLGVSGFGYFPRKESNPCARRNARHSFTNPHNVRNVLLKEILNTCARAPRYMQNMLGFAALTPTYAFV